MRSVNFTSKALSDLKGFKEGNAKLVFKVLEHIDDIQKNPNTGLGKPEPLKYDKAELWSRRITDEHRLIYKVTEETIEIYRCAGHY